MKGIIFRLFVDFLEKNKYPYVILGNVQAYPNEIGSDVDIAISTTHFPDLNKIIRSFCEENNIHVYNLLQHEVTGFFYAIFHTNKENSEITCIALDFCSDYMRQGRLILTSDQLLKDRQVIEQHGFKFYVSKSSIRFIYYLIKKIEKKNIDKAQFEFLLGLWNSDREGCNRELFTVFDQYSVLRIQKAFDSGLGEELSSDLLRSLSLLTSSRYSVSMPTSIKNTLRFVSRIIRPTGMVTAFYGCDGSGKSTLIHRLMSEANEITGFRFVSYHHLYPQKKSNTSVNPVMNPHEQKLRSVIGSNLKLVYFLFRYWIGYWLIVYPQKIRSGLVIFDRYYFDIYVDPRRYRHNGSEWLTKLVGYLLPKPDISIVVDVSPETLQSRKQEVSFTESKRQREGYLELANNHTNMVVVDNERDIEDAFFAVRSAIFKRAEERYKKRYK